MSLNSLDVFKTRSSKERVGKLYTPLVYGRICEMIERPTEKVLDKLSS